MRSSNEPYGDSIGSFPGIWTIFADLSARGYHPAAMHFALIDMILEQTPDRVRAVKQVTLAEEYLQDHFPTFQVLPGVFMLEALVQAGRALLEQRGHPRMVLGSAKAMRYGSFVRPGDSEHHFVSSNHCTNHSCAQKNEAGGKIAEASVELCCSPLWD